MLFVTSSLHDPLPVVKRSLFHFGEEERGRKREREREERN